ncbi:MAG: alpha/beta hydrolase [Lentisphaerae bacterium]|nr:alpha/beta hydrolase [Lentisphaerota bacterium]
MKILTGSLASGTTHPSPSLACWMPEHKGSGLGLIIFPGGGYGGLAEHEGRGYAEHFAKAGVACFVVTYRLGSAGFRHPAMLEDALAAIGTVRAHASELGVDPNRLGVMGSSAGGHLAAHAMGAWDRYASDVSLRPDFGVLCYPVILARGAHGHAGSMRNLAGDQASEALLESLSCERMVSATSPPCFLWHTGDDGAVPVENSLAMAQALRRHGVPFELHIYPKGAHGLGLGAPYGWAADCLRWMQETAGAKPARSVAG